MRASVMDRPSLLSSFEAHLDQTLHADPALAGGQKRWRRSRLEHGFAVVDDLEAQRGPVRGRVVVDVACAWGGEALAFAAAGARVLGFDLHDHRFAALNVWSRDLGLDARFAVASCDRLPLPNASVDVLLAFELVEHLPDVDAFAAEVARVLAPGGIALVTTPARLKSIFVGESHWRLKGIAALPRPCQRWLATRVFHRGYPYPITAQYLTAASVLRPFRRLSLTGRPQATGRLATRLARWPALHACYRQVAWDLLVAEKP